MSDEYVRKEDALNALAKAMPALTTPDGSGESDHDIQLADEAFVDAMQVIHEVKPADVVPVSSYKQVMWERDTAVEQLKQIGKGLGEVMDDVAPVVRCRDCEHYYFADNRIPQEQRYVCEINGEIWKPDDFCSFGKRREE